LQEKRKFKQMKDQISVSIVEDMADVRQKVKHIIEDSEEFICLSTYGNAESALEELSKLNPDIVLMDINLPGMSGTECLKKVK
jgi:DNA-binding NarL/FixJ family response regulator